MGVVLAFVVQCLLEERIDGWIRNLGEDDLRTRGRTAGGLLDCGKAALPALYRVYENPPSDEVKFRAGWLIDRIVQPILEEFRKKYRNRDVEWGESESPYLPGCRIVRWSRPCRCCCLHRGGHGAQTVLLSLRDGTTVFDEPGLATVNFLRRHLRPVKDEEDAVGMARFLFGPLASVTAKKSDDGMVVQVRGTGRLKHVRDPEEDVPPAVGTWTLRFDREGRLVSRE